MEEGKPVSTNADTRAYQRVFEALKQEPEFDLPYQFEDRILQKIEAKAERAERRETYWLVAGVLLLVLAAFIGAVLVGFKPSFGAFAFLSRYSGLLVFAVAFILLLQWLDRKIVHRTTY